MTILKLNQKPVLDFANVMDSFFNELPSITKYDSNWKNLAPVNITETDNGFTIEVIAPGFEKNDFSVNIEKDILTIAVNKNDESKANENNQSVKKQILREYSYRTFKRSFTLDETVDGEKIEAKYVNGVLTLNLPKKPIVKQSAKEISVQ